MGKITASAESFRKCVEEHPTVQLSDLTYHEREIIVLFARCIAEGFDTEQQAQTALFAVVKRVAERLYLSKEREEKIGALFSSVLYPLCAQ